MPSGDSQTSTLERAFELAASGTCSSVTEIRKRLSDEGYSTVQLTGKSLCKQLKGIIKERAEAEAVQPTSERGRLGADVT